MVSIGGITYVKAWNAALSQGATLLGQNAAAVAAARDRPQALAEASRARL
jgi:hypothetical protein